ncbi:PREDICTED: CDP-diacylglycerol--glycerol-3-phosphate 3-phosphatidyltransferase 2-like [Tarenaya hassleriana]|uniref:CDP-diacylglycerol--glycerol-3-phosphate 3-phosphatidyltransferase 2-like n=1 Tax=Tarenaya hassleriana TaxID=28532 RepID=UPI00053C55E3|nr:PREDICTED: CDP-diacylglycerol--glycerol-3-phosphate 3-phosphatidyltransferase 2-like [Tarenaya hassleriana]
MPLPMSGLKLSVAAASICTNPYKWVRTVSASAVASSNPRGRRRQRSPFSSSSLSNDANPRRTLLPCAPFAFSAHVSGSPSWIITDLLYASSHKGLGFPIRGSRHRPLCSPSSSSSSSSSERSGPSSSSGSGLVADMGQDDAVTADQNGFRHGHLRGCGNGGDDSLLRQSHSPSHQPPTPSSSKLLTLPTVLTLGRVAAVPLLVATFYVDSCLGRTATTSIFIAAAITDWLDGYIARKMRLGSAFGAFLDPVADKLMVAATLILLCTKPMDIAASGPVPWLMTVPSIAIIGREITMSAVREWAASQNGKVSEAVAVNNLGKWKTATQMTALTILLATRDSSFGGLVASGVALLYVSAGLSVWSLVVYMSKIWKVLLK